MQKLFAKIKTPSLQYKTGDLPGLPCGEYVLPALTAGIQNQGLNNYVPRDNAMILKNVISISANGANTGAAFYQNKEFTVLQDAYAIEWIYTKEIPSDRQYLFLTGCISKTIYGNYAWTKKAGWERIKTEKILLPEKNGEIDFDFMESFIAELEAERVEDLVAQQMKKLSEYLKVCGLNNYKLSDDEQTVIDNFDNLEYNLFNLNELFGKSTRGKRLKSADRIPGKLPFVTAGENNEGISDFIGNKVEVFSNNTITIDMFGSAKYRNYKYGADDHIAVVHTEKLSKYSAVFVTAAIHKSSHNGQFDYGKNFYAKDADSLWIKLPVKNNRPDYESMDLIISAIQKLVIKDLVLCTDKKIKAIRSVINKKPTIKYHK